VADDNRTNQLVISKILEHAGHTAYLVNNGQEALDALEKDEFNMLIMDMQMPVMGGIEAAKLYNFTSLGSKKIPIIILTANATLEAKQLCEEANVDGYLTKPIEAKKLLSAIHSINAQYHASVDPNISSNNIISLNTPNEQSYKMLNKNIIDDLISLSDDELFIKEIIKGFAKDSQNLLSQMETALSRKDYIGYKECLHALKGCAGSVGAERLHIACKDPTFRDEDPLSYVSNLKILNRIKTETMNDLLGYINSKTSTKYNNS
jgi:two-component system sensor histidine kinase RpfC